MNQSDKKPFAEAIRAAYKVKGQSGEIDEDVLDLYWSIFQEYSLGAFLAALKRSVAEISGRLEPAKIKSMLPCPLGHPGPEEAWGAVPKAEHETAYVTNEMMQALAAAEPLLGDKVAARMAFIEAYRRIVSEAKLRGQRARFWLSGASEGNPSDRLRLEQRARHAAESKGWALPPPKQPLLIEQRAEIPANIRKALIQAAKDQIK